jgi:hypothetical protein
MQATAEVAEIFGVTKPDAIAPYAVSLMNLR